MPLPNYRYNMMYWYNKKELNTRQETKKKLKFVGREFTHLRKRK
jgi:hypothetical protein